MRLLIFILPLLFFSCSTTRQTQNIQSNIFPVSIEKIQSPPAKENFYIFFLMGQSNMAGRGIVEPQDTISSQQVLMLNKNNEWVYAKEPLHYYEPSRTGLDCGLSFGKALSKRLGKQITIGLVPCAVGGSTIEQWLADSTHRDVKLYSNFLQKAKVAIQAGTVKGILWHQGENNATAETYKNYKEHLEKFFTRVRNDLDDADLPIYAGEVASFLNPARYPLANAVNKDLHALSATFKNLIVIKTADLTPLKDSIHFNSTSQRVMGKRFAEKVYHHR